MSPGKTGSLGRPWVQLEPKPPPVDDPERYWLDPPPELSERCRYWMRQIERGWLPNRSIRQDCADCQADWYGVYFWEVRHVLAPLLALAPELVAQERGALLRNVAALPRRIGSL